MALCDIRRRGTAVGSLPSRNSFLLILLPMTGRFVVLRRLPCSVPPQLSRAIGAGPAGRRLVLSGLHCGSIWQRCFGGPPLSQGPSSLQPGPDQAPQRFGTNNALSVLERNAAQRKRRLGRRISNHDSMPRNRRCPSGLARLAQVSAACRGAASPPRPVRSGGRGASARGHASGGVPAQRPSYPFHCQSPRRAPSSCPGHP